MTLDSATAFHFELMAATAADENNIKNLISEMRLNPFGLKWKNFIVAKTADNQFCGCGQLKPHRSGHMELASIAVPASFQKRGIAAAIIDYLIEQHGQRDLWLQCGSHMAAYYTRFDFEEIDTLAQIEPLRFRRTKRVANLIIRLMSKEEGYSVMVRRTN